MQKNGFCDVDRMGEVANAMTNTSASTWARAQFMNLEFEEPSPSML